MGARASNADRVNPARRSRFELVSTGDHGITRYPKAGWRVSLKRVVRVVIVVNRKERQKPRRAVLFSTDRQLEAATIYQDYKARFQIEFLFRDAKQFAGFSDCQARDQEAMPFHFNASVAPVNMARSMARLDLHLISLLRVDANLRYLYTGGPKHMLAKSISLTCRALTTREKPSHR